MWFKDVHEKRVKRHKKCINLGKGLKDMTLRHKILALTFDVVRRVMICGATRSLLQTIILSYWRHIFDIYSCIVQKESMNI